MLFIQQTWTKCTFWVAKHFWVEGGQSANWVRSSEFGIHLKYVEFQASRAVSAGGRPARRY